jgi:hypothetical protein
LVGAAPVVPVAAPNDVADALARAASVQISLQPGALEGLDEVRHSIRRVDVVPSELVPHIAAVWDACNRLGTSTFAVVPSGRPAHPPITFHDQDRVDGLCRHLKLESRQVLALLPMVWAVAEPLMVGMCAQLPTPIVSLYLQVIARGHWGVTVEVWAPANRAPVGLRFARGQHGYSLVVVERVLKPRDEASTDALATLGGSVPIAVTLADILRVVVTGGPGPSHSNWTLEEFRSTADGVVARVRTKHGSVLELEFGHGPDGTVGARLEEPA